MRPQSAKSKPKQQDISAGGEQVSPWTQARPTIVNTYTKSAPRPGTALAKAQASSKSQSKSTSKSIGRTTVDAVNTSAISGSKHVPKNIYQDKEQLYDQALRLKKDMNCCKDQNTQLKTQVLKYQKDLAVKENYIKELLSQLNAQQGSTDSLTRLKKIALESHLVPALKAQIKKLQGVHKDSCKELETIRRNVKYTKIYELEAEIHAYVEECKRLRRLLATTRQDRPSLASAGGHTAAEIATGPVGGSVDRPGEGAGQRAVAEKTQQLMSALQHKEAELTTWKDKAKKLEKQLLAQEKERAKDTVLERQREEKASAKAVEAATQELAKLRVECSEVKKSNEELAKGLKSKDRTIEEMEAKLNEAAARETTKAANSTELGLLRSKLKECT
jgi:hypothetical protein